MFCLPLAMRVPAAVTSWWPGIASTSRARLLALPEARIPSVAIPMDPNTFQPYAVFNTVLLFGDVGKTTYDSLQIKAETKTPKYGLYALVSYTYSKTYDNGLSDGLGSLLSAPYFPLPNWHKLDWGLSQINLDNNFTASIIYDLPIRQGQEVRQRLEWRGQHAAGELAVDPHRKNHFGVWDPADRQLSTSPASSFNSGGNGNNFNRPDQVAGCDPYAASHSKTSGLTRLALLRRPRGIWETRIAFRSPVRVSSTRISRLSNNLRCLGKAWA